jgi:hypothetical protein
VRTSEDYAERLLKDILAIDDVRDGGPPDFAERRLAVTSTFLEAFAASEFANYERQIVEATQKNAGDEHRVWTINAQWTGDVLRRIEQLERDTKSMDDAFCTRFKRLEAAIDARPRPAPMSFLTTPRAAVEELRAVHQPHGGPGWYWWDIEDHRDGTSGPFATWALAAADCQSVGYVVDCGAHRTPSVNKPRGRVRRYWEGSDGGASFTVIAKDSITALRLICQHLIDAGETDETDEISVGEITDEARIKACVIKGDDGGPLVDMPYGMVASSEY